jgi:hypothetical protein
MSSSSSSSLVSLFSQWCLSLILPYLPALIFGNNNNNNNNNFFWSVMLDCSRYEFPVVPSQPSPFPLGSTINHPVLSMVPHISILVADSCTSRVQYEGCDIILIRVSRSLFCGLASSRYSCKQRPVARTPSHLAIPWAAPAAAGHPMCRRATMQLLIAAPESRGTWTSH